MISKMDVFSEEVKIELRQEKKTLYGTLSIPSDAKALVIFVHGSGSSRFSPRNQFVAEVLTKSHFATLLMDLLTKEEEAVDLITSELRFDIPFLANRLLEVTEWVNNNPKTKHFKIGYFGSSTGAAAALIGAATLGEKISAVISRGGRADLAKHYLSKVRSPTLLIVGGNDFGVIELNEEAFSLIQVEKKLEIVPGATHLFEETGKLAEVAHIASAWFNKYL